MKSGRESHQLSDCSFMQLQTFYEFHSLHLNIFMCVWLPVVKCINNHNCSIQLLPSSIIQPFNSLFALSCCSVLLQGGLSNVLENWRDPKKEGLSCAYWSCWKWLKRDLCCAGRVGIVITAFDLSPRARLVGAPVAAVRKPWIPGAPSTHRTCRGVNWSSAQHLYLWLYQHTCTTSHHLSSIVWVWRAQLHIVYCANVSSLMDNYFVFKPLKSLSCSEMCDTHTPACFYFFFFTGL